MFLVAVSGRSLCHRTFFSSLSLFFIPFSSSPSTPFHLSPSFFVRQSYVSSRLLSSSFGIFICSWSFMCVLLVLQQTLYPTTWKWTTCHSFCLSSLFRSTRCVYLCFFSLNLDLIIIFLLWGFYLVVSIRAFLLLCLLPHMLSVLILLRPYWFEIPPVFAPYFAIYFFFITNSMSYFLRVEISPLCFLAAVVLPYSLYFSK